MPGILWSPAAAYTLLVLGVLLVYIELIRPGAILPGVVGLMLFCLGAHDLWRHSLEANGLGLCGLGVLLLVAEAVWAARFIAGALGTFALVAGSLLLCGDLIPAVLAVGGGASVGVTSTLLAAVGRRARANKATGAGRPQSAHGNSRPLGRVLLR